MSKSRLNQNIKSIHERVNESTNGVIVWEMKNHRAPKNYNNGQAREYDLRTDLTGRAVYADNIKATQAGDIADIQIKSAHGKICTRSEGTPNFTFDLMYSLRNDAASLFAYVTADRKKAYIMNKLTYVEFCEKFHGSPDTDSHGLPVWRLGRAEKRMTEWFEARI